jgi:hypothetical protein
VTQAEYARRRGISREAVRRASCNVFLPPRRCPGVKMDAPRCSPSSASSVSAECGLKFAMSNPSLRSRKIVTTSCSGTVKRMLRSNRRNPLSVSTLVNASHHSWKTYQSPGNSGENGFVEWISTSNDLTRQYENWSSTPSSVGSSCVRTSGGPHRNARSGNSYYSLRIMCSRKLSRQGDLAEVELRRSAL